jgi:hypothetical protein
MQRGKQKVAYIRNIYDFYKDFQENIKNEEKNNKIALFSEKYRNKLYKFENKVIKKYSCSSNVTKFY